MFKLLIATVALATTVLTAEISSSYALLEKQSAFKPNIQTNPVDHVKRDLKHSEHPVYKPEGTKNEGRARIEPVKSKLPIIRSEMLSDQPAPSTEVNRIDNAQSSFENAFIPPRSEVAYPDIPYAPGYGYDPNFGANGYDLYSNGLSNYYPEQEPSAWGLLWSQVPDARTMVTFVGRSVTWIFESILVLTVGSIITVALCSYTNLCTIHFHGIGPIHEEMRSLMSPERLEKIGHAAEFVKTAIDKYQKIQKVSDAVRSRRSIYY